MKVVLFCGGLGTRLREHSDTIPKPLVNVGYRPILWHLMRYYAHFGHKDFVLCLGYRGDLIREYFLNYNECMSNDFVLSRGRQEGRAAWHATSTTGASPSSTPACTRTSASACCACASTSRARAEFLANYADGLSDLPLDRHIEDFRRSEAVASFAAVRTGAELPRRARRTTTASSLRFGPMREQRTSGSTAASSACASEIFDYIERRRRAGRAAVRAPDRASASSRRTGTTASGRRWTRSRTRSPSTAWRRAATARGWSGSG